MVHRDDSYRRVNVRDRVAGTVFDDRKILTAGSLIKDEQIVVFEKIDVFAHQPGIIAPFDRHGA